jgi:membrane-associated phospholipid phosphatase
MKQRRRVFNSWRFGVLLMLILGSVLSAFGQTDSVSLWRGYPLSFLKDTRDLILFPKFVEKKDGLFIGLGAAAMAGSFFLDESLEKEIRLSSLRANLPDDLISYGVEHWGSGLYPGIAAVGLYGLGALKDNPELKYIAMVQVKTIGLAAAASRVPKVLLQRHRPDQYAAPDAFVFEGPFHGLTGNYSYTSGHTFIAFAWASASAELLQDRPVWQVVVYTLATSVAVSRVAEGDHWLSDVAGGAVLGYALGKLTVRFQERNWRKKPSGN